MDEEAKKILDELATPRSDQIIKIPKKVRRKNWDIYHKLHSLKSVIREITILSEKLPLYISEVEGLNEVQEHLHLARARLVISVSQLECQLDEEER
ncbi:MAG: hypothetical protein ACTSU3_00155 [Candidatus Thorarchaeota archaeon]